MKLLPFVGINSTDPQTSRSLPFPGGTFNGVTSIIGFANSNSAASFTPFQLFDAFSGFTGSPYFALLSTGQLIQLVSADLSKTWFIALVP
jgi:hypothetical protein